MPSKDFVVTVSPRYDGSKRNKNPAITDLQLWSLLLIGILAITKILNKKTNLLIPRHPMLQVSLLAIRQLYHKAEFLHSCTSLTDLKAIGPWTSVRK